MNHGLIFPIKKSLKSLETLDRHDQTHNDIKPQNFLVKFKNGPNDLTQIQIVLTDFGMAGLDSKGGTPIFSSPECLANTERKYQPDIFSLGRVFLFVVLPKKLFLEFLFVPISNQAAMDEINDAIISEPIFHLISEMIKIKKRIGVQEIKNDLRKIKTFKAEITIKNISKIVRKYATTETKDYIHNIEKIS